jgi:signal transduction histidine kinase/CHASE3 domain sensor protein
MKSGHLGLSPRTIMIAGMILLALLCTACTTMFLRLERHRAESRIWLNHTYLVLSEINNLSAKLKDIELGQRGYLLTGLDEFLAPYRAARGMQLSADDAVAMGTVDTRSVEQILFNLTTLTDDNPAQRMALNHLSDLIQAKTTEVEHVLDLWHSQGSHMAIRVLTTADSQHTMAAIQVTMTQMINREKILLGERQESDNRADLVFTTFAASAGGAMFLCLFITFLLMWRSFISMRGTEQELLVKERQFRLVVDGGADAFFLFRAERTSGSMTHFAPSHLNSHAMDMTRDLGLEAGDVSLQRLRQSFRHQADHDPTDLELFERQQFRQSEASPTAGPLADRHFQEQIIPVPDGLAITYRDITEQKQVVRMKNEFISTVSHELRTPLTSIRGSLGLITAGTVGQLPGPAMNLIKIAHTNCERLVRLINDILDIDKLEAGKVRMVLKPVPLAATLRAAIEANAGYAQKFGIKLVLELPEDEVAERIFVTADADRVMQVLANLLSNAVKFSASGSEVPSVHRPSVPMSRSETWGAESPISFVSEFSASSPKPTPRTPATRVAPGWA